MEFLRVQEHFAQDGHPFVNFVGNVSVAAVEFIQIRNHDFNSPLSLGALARVQTRVQLLNEKSVVAHPLIVDLMMMMVSWVRGDPGFRVGSMLRYYGSSTKLTVYK